MLNCSLTGRRRMGPLEKYKRPVEGVMSSKIFSGIRWAEVFMFLTLLHCFRQQKDTGGKITWPSVSSAGECESTWRQTLAATCRVWYYWLTYQCRFFFPPENEGCLAYRLYQHIGSVGNVYQDILLLRPNIMRYYFVALCPVTYHRHLNRNFAYHIVTKRWLGEPIDEDEFRRHWENGPYHWRGNHDYCRHRRCVALFTWML